MSRTYEILGTAGHGGMGAVYRARLRADGGVEKVVALKVLSDQVRDDADLARRLRDEARILGRLQHRAIVRVEGLLRLAGRWTVAMEYVDGVDLAQVAEKRGKLPLAAVLEVLREVGSALHHAHGATDADGQPLRIVHRDLKPGNLRLTPSGDIKVLDFGVARAQFEGREAETRAGGFGSLGYVPPERVDGDDIPAGDVYALGIIAWELLSGDRFGPGHLLSKKHADLLAERMTAVQKAPAPVRDLLASMLQFDPDKRPTAREVERKAIELLDTVKSSERLRDWAESNVAVLAKEVNAELQPGELVGQTFTEEPLDGQPRSVVPASRRAAPRPAGRSWLRIAMWLVLLGGVLVATPILLTIVLALGMYVGTLLNS